MHKEEPGVEVKAHNSQDPAPFLDEILPISQSVQDAEENSEYFPALQSSHVLSLFAAVAPENFPETQLVHV